MGLTFLSRKNRVSRLLHQHFAGTPMRRTAQYQLQAGQDRVLAVSHVEAALEEMLFSGGSLNVKLLGGAVNE